MSGVYVTSATAHETKRYEPRANDTTRCGEPNETKHPLSIALSALREYVCEWCVCVSVCVECTHAHLQLFPRTCQGSHD